MSQAVLEEGSSVSNALAPLLLTVLLSQMAWMERVIHRLITGVQEVVLEAVLLAISRRVWYWGVVMPLVWVGASAAGRLLAVRLHNKVIVPLLRVLADDERIRQRSLAVGAVLFVVAFLLQLIATF